MARSLNSRNLDAIAKQLLEKKIRRSNQDHRTDTSDAETRIVQISTAFKANPELHELRRHSIVALVAALQTYHRGYIADIMDNDPISRIRGANLVGEKFPLSDILMIIGGEEISISDLIAHAAPINSVDDIITWLSGVFGEDFKTLLTNAVPPQDRNDTEDAPRIIDNVETLLADLSKAFRLRHILAHEAALDFEIEETDVSEVIEAVQLWVNSTRGVLWQTVLRNEPYTQFEMSISASNDYRISRTRLAAAIFRVRRVLGLNERRRFFRNHQNWLKNIMEFIEITYGSNQGTMWPALRAMDISRAFNTRSEQIEEWAGYCEL